MIQLALEGCSFVCVTHDTEQGDSWYTLCTLSLISYFIFVYKSFMFWPWFSSFNCVKHGGTVFITSFNIKGLHTVSRVYLFDSQSIFIHNFRAVGLCNVYGETEILNII